jgi:kumamolisin
MYGVPSYQNNVNIPATLTTVAGALSAGTPGRGLPDIAANASPDSAIDGMYVGGVITAIGGTSAASPLMAGIFARINASLGYNVGFINPTLYMLGTNNSYARCMNSGGATSNAWTDTSVTPSVNYPGYNLSLTSWNACVGLGVINATNLLAYIKTNNVVPVALKNYFIKIQASNGSGNGPMSIASGPFTVTT